MVLLNSFRWRKKCMIHASDKEGISVLVVETRYSISWVACL